MKAKPQQKNERRRMIVRMQLPATPEQAMKLIAEEFR